MDTYDESLGSRGYPWVIWKLELGPALGGEVCGHFKVPILRNQDATSLFCGDNVRHCLAHRGSGFIFNDLARRFFTHKSRYSIQYIPDPFLLPNPRISRRGIGSWGAAQGALGQSREHLETRTAALLTLY